MKSRYTEETQKILHDSLSSLSEVDEINKEFLNKLSYMFDNCTLASISEIREAINILKDHIDEFQD